MTRIGRTMGDLNNSGTTLQTRAQTARTMWARLLSRRRPGHRQDAITRVAVLWLVVLIGAAILADVLPLEDPIRPDYGNIGGYPSLDHLLGGDYLGRDMLSRIVFGSRVSLVLGFGAVTLCGMVGGAIGVIAGYKGGVVARIVMVGSDVILAFPSLVLIIAIVAVFGASLFKLIIALAFLGVPGFIRIARAHTLVVCRREFVLAARAYGAKSYRIMLREIFPSVFLPLVAYGLVLVGIFIVAAGALSFLGLGVPPPTPTWGGMIAAGRDHLISRPHESLIPAGAMFLTVLSVNVVGQRIQGRMDIRENVL